MQVFHKFARSFVALGWVMLAWSIPAMASAGASSPWLDQLVQVPHPNAARQLATQPTLQVLRQDYEQLQRGQSVVRTPLIIGKRRFEHGLGTHSFSHLRVTSPEPIARFEAWIGVNMTSEASRYGTVSFQVKTHHDSKLLYASPVLRGGEEPRQVSVEVGDEQVLDLYVDDGGDGPTYDHADWGEAKVVTKSGKEIDLDRLEPSVPPALNLAYPFSFIYDRQKSDDLLPKWSIGKTQQILGEGRQLETTTWTDPQSGLKVAWQLTRFSDYPALDWVLYFENTGAKDTAIVQDIRALDCLLTSPIYAGKPYYTLHKTNGAPANPTDFEVSQANLIQDQSEHLGGGGGRSSNKDFPFFKIDGGLGSLIVAIGWSGQWAADLSRPDPAGLHLQADIEKTHFMLHPGERVRTARILLMHWNGESLEANAQFRQLIYKHYLELAERRGSDLLQYREVKD